MTHALCRLACRVGSAHREGWDPPVVWTTSCGGSCHRAQPRTAIRPGKGICTVFDQAPAQGRARRVGSAHREGCSSQEHTSPAPGAHRDFRQSRHPGSGRPRGAQARRCPHPRVSGRGASEGTGQAGVRRPLPHIVLPLHLPLLSTQPQAANIPNASRSSREGTRHATPVEEMKKMTGQYATSK